MEQENNTSNQPNAPTSAPQPEPTPPPTPEPSHDAPRKPKALITTAITCAILAVAGIAFGIYGMFFQPQPKCETNCEQTSGTASDIQESTSESNEEVEITNTYILRDLDEKLALLHFTHQTSPTLSFHFGLHSEFPLYKEGNLNDTAKLTRVVYSLGNYSREAYASEKEAIAANFGLSEFETSSIEVINADIADDKYYDTFGEKPVRETTIDRKVCNSYTYDQSLNIYFSIPGCGGTSSLDSNYYKTKYTTQGDHAYVYVKTAVMDFSSGNIYCDAGSFETENAALCGSGTKNSDGMFEFSEDSIDHDSLATYRFIFNLADNGTYYFEKVEKV